MKAMKVLALSFLSLGILITAQPLKAAEAGKGPYLSVAGGWSTRNDVDSTPTGGGNTTKINHDDGYRAAAAVGYAYGNGIRVDLEVAYAEYEVDSMSHPLINGGSNVDGTGDVSSWSFMLSGYYDFTNDSPLTPSIGLGVGPVRVSSNNASANNANFTTTDDSDWVVGVGLTAGVAYAVSDNVDLTAEYKFLWSTDPEMTDSAGTKSEQDGINSHTIQVGLRYNF